MSGTQIVLSTTPEFLRATFDFRLSDKVLRIIVALRKFRCGTRKLITDKALRIIVALGNVGVVLMKFMLKRLSYKAGYLKIGSGTRDLGVVKGEKGVVLRVDE